MAIHEKCGVIASQSSSGVDLEKFQKAWKEIQSRGVHGAGFFGRDGKGEFSSSKVMRIKGKGGSIDQVFSALDINDSENPYLTAIGHNRYATSEGANIGQEKKNFENIQPLLYEAGEWKIIFGHNGNLPAWNVDELRKLLLIPPPEDASDSSIMARLLLQQRQVHSSWEETLVHTLPLFKGAFSLVMMVEDGTLYAIKDPWGVRPLALGQTEKEKMVASETVSFDAIGVDYQREVLPGEIRIIPPNGPARSLMYAATDSAKCTLEKHYFSQPASFDGQDTQENYRKRLGEGVAQRFLAKKIQADCVVPILNGGRYSAVGFAAATGLPLVEAIAVKDNAERSYIQNTTGDIKATINEKHIITPKHLEGQRVVFVDDSLIRGTSLEILMQRVKELNGNGPTEIHVVLGSPPVIEDCDLGFVISKAELATRGWTDQELSVIEKNMAEKLGVTSVTYSTRETVYSALQVNADQVCDHCFGGQHPLLKREPTYRAQVEAELRAQQVLFFASGSGTNVHAILEAVERGDVLALPMGVITNVEGAGVIDKAEKFKVGSEVIPSKGRIKDPEQRAAYFQEILNFLQHSVGLPDVIVLAGWNLILPDFFLEFTEANHIDVMNIHPALLSGKGQEKVMTSKGLVPEIRGAHGIDDSFHQSIEEMPVAGVTVHLVKPGGQVDTGQVIIKQEVARRADETLEEFERRIHATEYDIFYLGLQEVLLRRLDKKAASIHIASPKGMVV